MTRNQAEAIAKGQRDALASIDDRVATKSDIAALVSLIKDNHKESKSDTKEMTINIKWIMAIGAGMIAVIGAMAVKINEMSAALAVIAELVKN